MKLFEDGGFVIYWLLLLASAYAHFEHVQVRLCLIIHERGEKGEFPRAAVASPESRTGNST